MSVRIITGDCLTAMRDLPDCSADAVVTDPPYGLSFMGKKWDYDVPSTEIWAECLRVLKPGGHLLAFAGTRTQHRMAVRIEDAGFEIRDMIAWVYGSGFPKSHNGEWGGTALKPALEPITVARKPLIGTVAANVLEYGTGAINVDGCRVGTEGATKRSGQAEYPKNPDGTEDRSGSWARTGHAIENIDAGRWPANLIHDGSDEVLAAFPVTGASSGAPRNNNTSLGSSGANVFGKGGAFVGAGHADNGGSAARFFYCAKASKQDREEGLEHLDAVHRPNGNKWTDQDYRVARGERPPSAESGPRRNTHPTVKPTDLMRYLCRLVTPPGGAVLDPFMGSGSTGKAAVIEGFGFVGIERDAEYAEIAKARIAAATMPLFAEVAA
ncbi:MAG: site-specific DNA-methyltransferase [Porticoccus sp.]|jgi:site-specific DNA-methyltransferase (adenine-specific)|uniref:DNA-methyltransferase n=1 Tax=Pseudomonadota TaxID=1224 RepID=UPI000C3556ED|nr:site-specific DNA-methyltransferase [Rhodospirillaceae bacterium]MAY26210.1 site-specific DNA-methyltransferase [Polycyclovorans sp.]MBG58033.1 site-specific DNA-methyltransferase [Porticoccus sp.]QDP49865.1 MAG: putative modification methylase [Prokaryotic dsDNA virus sp.]MAX61638.1 site-specific DNA-methyltransferase [Rhodospirillaceae bacterium]|tara:strand:+ start:14516 stop:15661 length:1146 start_codon:yes stop_codon:yes gene_type:complete